MNENIFDQLLNHLNSEEKDMFFLMVEDFNQHVKSDTAKLLIEKLLKDIAES